MAGLKNGQQSKVQIMQAMGVGEKRQGRKMAGNWL